MKRVPKLRFKEFSDEWEEKKFEEIFRFLQNNTFSRENLTQKKQKVQNIHYGDILTKYNYILKIDENIPFIKEENNLAKFMNDSYLKTGDIVFADTAEDFSVGKAIEIKNNSNKKVLSGLHTFPCRTINKFALGYLGFYLNSTQYHSQLFSLITGIKVSSISKQSIKETLIKFPIYEEQEKIANFLSSVDKKITLTEEKLELFKQYKKGIMQKIFSQEMRFKDSDGNDYPDWEEKRIEDIAKIGMGFTPSTKDTTCWNGEYKWLSIADLKENGKYIYKTTKMITEKGAKNKNILLKGMLIMSFKLTLGRVGILKDSMYTNEAICHFHWKEIEKINVEYMYYYLSSIDIKEYGKQAIKGVTLNSESLNSIIIKLPCMEEQKKIGGFLSSIDEKIENIEKELEGLKEFKKGLLQKMFV